MSPLFIILFFVISVLVVTLLAFLVAVIFQPREWALRSAVVFVCGVLCGAAVTGVLSLFVIGVAALFNTSFEPSVYLVPLVAGGIVGGCLAIGLFIRARGHSDQFRR